MGALPPMLTVLISRDDCGILNLKSAYSPFGENGGEVGIVLPQITSSARNGRWNQTMLTGRTKGISRIVLILAMVPLLSILLGGCISSVRPLPTPTPWPTPVALEKSTYTVERGTIVDIFSLSGEVVPVEWATGFFRVAGELASINVVEGDIVQQGDILAELEMTSLLEEMSQAQLTLEQADDRMLQYENSRNYDLERTKLKLDLAEITLQKARQSGDATEIALLQIQVQLAQLDVQEVEEQVNPALDRDVTKAKLAMIALERQIEARRLRAPISGRVIAVGVGLKGIRSPIRRSNVGDQIPALAPLVVVAKPDPIEIIVPSDKPRVSEIYAGQMVTVTHPWARNQPFSAEVTATPLWTASADEQPGFPQAVHIALPEERPEMQIGGFVTVDVLSALHADTLILPQSAVRRFAGRNFVVFQDGDRQRRVDVTIGLENVTHVEILDGLSEGDVVLGP